MDPSIGRTAALRLTVICGGLTHAVNLIATSRELGVLGEDVVKHADAVRAFRNGLQTHQSSSQ